MTKKKNPAENSTTLATTDQSANLFLSDTIQDVEQELIDIKGDIKSINNDVVHLTKGKEELEKELSVNWRKTISMDRSIAYLDRRKEELDRRTWMLLGLHVLTVITLVIVTIY